MYVIPSLFDDELSTSFFSSSGGVVIGGQADSSIVIIAKGGVKIGGHSIDVLNCHYIANGGVKIAGKSRVSRNGEFSSMGGVVIGGHASVVEHFVYHFASSGGVKIGNELNKRRVITISHTNFTQNYLGFLLQVFAPGAGVDVLFTDHTNKPILYGVRDNDQFIISISPVVNVDTKIYLYYKGA